MVPPAAACSAATPHGGQPAAWERPGAGRLREWSPYDRNNRGHAESSAVSDTLTSHPPVPRRSATSTACIAATRRCWRLLINEARHRGVPPCVRDLRAAPARLLRRGARAARPTHRPASRRCATSWPNSSAAASNRPCVLRFDEHFAAQTPQAFIDRRAGARPWCALRAGRRRLSLRRPACRRLRDARRLPATRWASTWRACKATKCMVSACRVPPCARRWPMAT